MSDVTVQLPNVGQESLFQFKEPFASAVASQLNNKSESYRLKVTSITSIRDIARVFRKDPFMDIYNKVALSEVEYRQDLNDDIMVLTFGYYESDSTIKQFHVPLNYIRSISNPNAVEYAERSIVIALGSLPVGLDLGAFYDDIKEFIVERVGVDSVLSDVSVGKVEVKSQEDHIVLENMRSNLATVRVPLGMRVRELEALVDSMTKRLDSMGIVLGDE